MSQISKALHQRVFFPLPVAYFIEAGGIILSKTGVSKTSTQGLKFSDSFLSSLVESRSHQGKLDPR